MKRTGFIKCLVAVALVAALVALVVWMVGMYRSSLVNYLQTTEKCLSLAADNELNKRLFSLDQYNYWKNPYKDTATYVNTKIEIDDGRIFNVLVNRKDPTVMTKIRQFTFQFFCPLNTANLDSIFRNYMAEYSLPVKTSYVEYFNLEKDSLIESNAAAGKLSGYVASAIDTLDIMKTIGVRANVKIPAYVILRPVMFEFITSIVLIIITMGCIIKLLIDILRIRREGIRMLRTMAMRTDNLLNEAAGSIKRISEDLERQQWMEEAEQFNALYERLNDTSVKNRKIGLILDNDAGKLKFCETPVELESLFKELQEKYECTEHKKVTVSISVQPGLILYVDEAFFTGIMEELMDNAVKFSRKTVNIDINAMQDTQNLVISVRDNGWGIHNDEIGMVFELFYKGLLHDMFLPADKEGLGVGLSFVQSLMHSFGGKVYTTSKQHAYTEVTLEFPITQDQKNAVQAFKLIYKKITSLN